MINQVKIFMIKNLTNTENKMWKTPKGKMDQTHQSLLI
jgi:hypothetical protein